MILCKALQMRALLCYGVFPMYESLPEQDDVQEPFTEATRLLKRPYHGLYPVDKAEASGWAEVV